MNKEITASLDEIEQVVRYLDANVPPNAIIFLRGDLAAGKTTLVQAIAKDRGIEGDATSPTFSLQHYYGNDLYHYDLYRISDEEFMELGLLEEFEQDGWHMVEWGSDYLEDMLKNFGYKTIAIEIKPDASKRVYTIFI